ncbi:aldo/keto reductase [Lapillicoccus sp.]|uniref:aldo/keto reductase n=1 Tax=Lapillicoccus sp. TaxID=1909287 RepID=UPI0025DBE884|nr:aldo/keto reductase [Lapillicoccus sp.]
MTSLDLGSLVLGGNVFGWTADRDESFAVLDAFVAGGGVSIDTADAYSQWVPGNSGGDSELIIGEWLASRGNRDAVEIHTKVFAKTDRPGLSPANLQAAVDDSLSRLQTDHLDVYYAHRDDDAVDQADYVAGFDALVRSGKVREVGASNFSAGRLASALDIAAAEGLTPFTVAQDKWSLVERDIESQLVPTLRDRGIVQLPYSSLGSGFLTGKYRPGTSVESARAQAAGRYLERPGATTLLDTLDEIADARGTSVTAVSLAWLRVQPTVGAPIASARTVQQVQPLLDSMTLTLADDELARLDKASAALG